MAVAVKSGWTLTSVERQWRAKDDDMVVGRLIVGRRVGEGGGMVRERSMASISGSSLPCRRKARFTKSHRDCGPNVGQLRLQGYSLSQLTFNIRLE